MRSYRKRFVDHIINFNLSWYGLKKWLGVKAVAAQIKDGVWLPRPHVYARWV